jgi:hypothetical protein
MCQGYIEGVLDALKAEAVIAKRPSKFCLPDAASLTVVDGVVTDFIGNHPESREKDASSVVWTAMLHAFPCPPGDNTH